VYRIHTGMDTLHITSPYITDFQYTTTSKL